MTVALMLAVGGLALAPIAFAVKHRCVIAGHCPCDRCGPDRCLECGWRRAV